MPNLFQSAIQSNAPSGLTKSTAVLTPSTSKSIGIGIFSDLTLAAVHGWSGIPAGWAGLGGSNSIGFVNVTGVTSVQAGPILGTDPNSNNWAATLLLFAATTNLSLSFTQAITSGAYGGTVSNTVGADIPAGCTMLAIQNGTAQFFPATPDLSSVSDTAGNIWSAPVRAVVLSGSNVIAEAAVSVAMNCVHSLPGTNIVSMVMAGGGNNAQAIVYGITGPVPLNGGFTFGSMLI